jgi:hypothetical protein
MVNTGRYGGCGGSRAVYSAANSQATEIAVHELGHSLAGLADEYSYDPGCGSFAGEINTTSDPLGQPWKEWVSQIGAPRQGAQYYQQCLYRPIDNCEMRNLDVPFCPVCNQRWSLVTFGHARVAPTAPVASGSPPSPAAAWVGVPVEFSVATRLSIGPAVTNSFTWSIEGPGYPTPTVVATGAAAHSHGFGQPGSYVVRCEVVADTNFVRPQKYGANRDVATWAVDVTVLAVPGEVSPPGSAEPVRFADRTTLVWEDAEAGGAFTYNVYRADVASLPSGDYGTCVPPGALPEATTTVSEDPPVDAAWFYLVSGENPAGEGPLGEDSAGNPRIPGATCGDPAPL